MVCLGSSLDEENGIDTNIGSIELTTDEILFQKLTIINSVCSIPKKNTQSRIVTQKQINSFDFILGILANENAIELILAFYRIGKKTNSRVIPIAATK